MFLSRIYYFLCYELRGYGVARALRVLRTPTNYLLSISLDDLFMLLWWQNIIARHLLFWLLVVHWPEKDVCKLKTKIPDVAWRCVAGAHRRRGGRPYHA